MTTLQPALRTERNHFLDLWRGFAITGVLLAYIMWNLGNLPQEKWNEVDKWIAKLTEILVDGKFYTTLSILFGMGFYLQLERSRRNQQSIVPVALRRIFLLLAIGTIHAIFLRRGDILVPYACCSLYLFFARNAGNKTLILLMILCLLFPSFYYQFIKWIGYKNSPWEKDNGSYLHYMWVAFKNFHKPVYFFVGNLDYFMLFLFGFYAAKNNWLQKLSSRPKTLLVIFAAGAAMGVALFFVMDNAYDWLTVWFGPYDKMNYVQKMLTNYTGALCYLLHRAFLAIAYFSGLYFLFLRNYKMTVFANMGRMALSNYLMQSLIMVPACFVFGLFDKFTPTQALAWSAAIWIVQAILCTWWLKRYNFGPFEWLLRSFTYWKWQPMKSKE